MAKRVQTFRHMLGRDVVHPFPARMAPDIAIQSLRAIKNKRARVLDPMMGSGTVVALARAAGHRSIGIDIDPLAVLLARVWSTALDHQRYLQVADIILSKAKITSEKTSASRAFPSKADAETRAFIRYWFDTTSRRQLNALAAEIKKVRTHALRDALWCAFSRLIIVKTAGASRARDLAHSRPHRTFSRSPIRPLKKFPETVRQVLAASIDVRHKKRGIRPRISQGDARHLPVRSNSVDFILTSPPYLNAIDYMRCSKFSLVWMGLNVSEIAQLRRESVGSEVGYHESRKNVRAEKVLLSLGLRKNFPQRQRKILLRFIADMDESVREASRVLVPGGRATYVVGENTVRGTYIRNASIIAKLARRAGLRLIQRNSRRLPPSRRYLPPPIRRSDNRLDIRMRREVVLTFRKPK